MQTKERRNIDIALTDAPSSVKVSASGRGRAVAVLAVAVLVLLALVVGLCLSVANGVTVKKALREQQQTVASLQQQLETQKSEMDALQSQNDTLKSEAEDLKVDNEALKAQIAKYGLQYPASVYEGKKLVALTFDDGPGPYTAELLDFLKEHHARVTFFLLGTNAARYPALVKRMDEEGHAIGNHSHNHPNLTALSAAGVSEQVAKCNAAINKAVGHNAVVMRCPGGSQNATVRQAVGGAGLPLIHWSLDTLDWKLRNKEKIIDRTFNEIGVKDGDIVLMHDIHRESVDAVKEMIVKLQADGYMLVTVPELLSVRKGGMQAGTLYVSAGK